MAVMRRSELSSLVLLVAICSTIQLLHGQNTCLYSSRYQLVENSRSWTQAQRDCRDRGGYLVSVFNSTDSQFLNTTFTTNHWIGLSDRSTEGELVWEDGMPLDFANWAPGEPRNSMKRDCALSTSAGWVLSDCNQDRPYVCEFDLVLDQWSRCGQLEYQYFTTPANWSDAERQCQTHGGNLANVEGFVSRNCALQSFQSCDTGSAWVGLGSILSANDYRWTSDLTITSQFQFNFLAFRELEFCAVLGRPLSYRLEKCRLFNTYICQRRPASAVFMPFRYQCGNIIIRYMTVTFSWASASQRCAAEGGELLSLNNTDAVQCTHDFFASAITESINPSLWSVLAWVNCVQEPCGPGICRTVAFGNSSTPEAVNTSCGAARPAICTILPSPTVPTTMPPTSEEPGTENSTVDDEPTGNFSVSLPLTSEGINTTTSTPPSTETRKAGTDLLPEGQQTGQRGQLGGGDADDSSNAGAIAGGVVGGLLALVVMLVVVFVVLKRRRRSRSFNVNSGRSAGSQVPNPLYENHKAKSTYGTDGVLDGTVSHTLSSDGTETITGYNNEVYEDHDSSIPINARESRISSSSSQRTPSEYLVPVGPNHSL